MEQHCVERKCVFGTNNVHYPLGKSERNSRERQEKIHNFNNLTEPNLRFNIGGGMDNLSKETAANIFMDREFPSISDGSQNEPIFIPEFFISNNPGVLDTREEVWNDQLGDKNAAKLRKKSEKRDFSGDETERIAFEMLHGFFTSRFCKDKKIVVMHAWKNHAKIQAAEAKSEIEFDFLIICLEKKAIINIECKTTLNRSKCGAVFKQLYERQRFLEDNFDIGPDWTYWRCIFASTYRSASICDVCITHALSPYTDIAMWWNTISHTQPNSTEADSTYVHLIRAMTHLSHINNNYVTTTDFGNKLRSQFECDIGTISNRMLWTKSQYKAFYSQSKRVYLTGAFGTGKTVLLLSKCLEVANSGESERCYYIQLPLLSNDDSKHLVSEYILSLIFLQIKSAFEEKSKFKNAKAITYEDMILQLGIKATTVAEVVIAFIEKQGPNVHLFFDEYLELIKPTCDDGKPIINSNNTRLLQTLHEKVDKYHHVWVAHYADFDVFDPEGIIRQNFTHINLCGNMRNSSNIVKAAGGELMKWNNFPKGREYKSFEITLTRYSGPENNQKVIQEVLRKSLSHLKGDLNDLVILLDGNEIAQSVKTYFKEEFPKYNSTTVFIYLTNDDHDTDTCNFFTRGRKGLVVTCMGLAQGTEFKSVIVFCRVNDASKSKEPHDISGLNKAWTLPVSQKNYFQRAVVNLISIDYKRI